MSAELVADAVRPVLTALSAGRCAEAVAMVSASMCSSAELREVLASFPANFGTPPANLAPFLDTVAIDGTNRMSVWAPLFDHMTSVTDLQLRLEIEMRGTKWLVVIEDLRVP